MLRKRRTVPPRRVLGLEVLEDRSLLSGNVTATLSNTGTLVINGDAGNNAIQILPDPFGPTKSIRVVAEQWPGISDEWAGTTVNNGQFATFDMTTFGDILINFQDGNNLLNIDGPLPLANGLLGSLTIVAGKGSNTLMINNLKANSMILNAAGPGNDRVHLTNVTASKMAMVTTGQGTDTAVVTNINTDTLTINTGLGPNNDYVRVVGGSTIGTLTINAGDGDQNVGIEDTTISKGLTVNVGQHSNYVEIQRNTIQNGANITIGQGGKNNQNVLINDNIFLQGDLNLTVGDGLDSGSATVVALGRNKLATGTANVTIGNNTANVLVETLTANGSANGAGSVNITVGKNAQNVALSNVSSSSAAARDLTLAVGDGAATVSLTNIQAGGSVRIDGSTDNANTNWNVRFITASTNVTMSTGTGRNTIALDQISQARNLTVSLGNGANSLLAHAVRVGGGNINGGGNPLSVYYGISEPTNTGFNVTGFGKYL